MITLLTRAFKVVKIWGEGGAGPLGAHKGTKKVKIRSDFKYYSPKLTLLAAEPFRYLETLGHALSKL